MDGFEVCAQLKEQEETRDIPIIFLSALKETFSKVKAFQIGAVDYISWPFEMEEVVARVRTHVNLRAYQKRIAETNIELLEKFETLVENIPQKVFIKDKEGKYVSCNTNFAQDLGFELEEIVGKSDADFYPNDKAEKCREDDQVVLDTKTSLDRIEKIETADQTQWIHMIKKPVFDGKGNVFGVLGILWDITKQKEAEQREKDYQEKLLQADKLATLGTLVTGVAHEINNPNNIIMFNAPLIKDITMAAISLLEKLKIEENNLQLGGIPYEDIPQTLKDLFDGIDHGANQIGKIVADLKSYSRPDGYNMDQELDLNEVVQKATGLLKNLIYKSTQNFNVTYGKDLPKIRGDFHRLEQVVVNLLQNACEALERDESGIFVETFYKQQEQMIILTIRDEGKGMTPEELKFLTDPFYTTKRDRGGTGLGFSVVSRILHEHRGNMKVTSEPGEGSRFTLRFPTSSNPPKEA